MQSPTLLHALTRYHTLYITRSHGHSTDSFLYRTEQLPGSGYTMVEGDWPSHFNQNHGKKRDLLYSTNPYPGPLSSLH
jgi:hypothetical protein